MLGKIKGARVLRGGSWATKQRPDIFQCTHRDLMPPTLRSHRNGFRCATTQ